MKQKVIALLEPYRDKTLSKGCLITGNGLHNGEILIMHENHPYVFNATVLVGSYRTSEHLDFDKRNIEIIGHPFTHEDLLRALSDEDCRKITIEQDDEVEDWLYMEIGYKETDGYGKYMYIPLNHRTIEDIPGTDPMWEQLLEVLSK